MIDIKSRDDKIEVEISRDEKKIIRVEKEGKKIYLGSRFNVKKDIDNLLSILEEAKPNTILIVFGLATGEYVKTILHDLGESNRVIIIEPNVNIIDEFIKSEFYNDIKDDVRLIVSNIDEIDKIKFNYKVDLLFATYQSYGKIYLKEYLYMKKYFLSYVEKEVLYANTNKVLGELWGNNIIKNLKHMTNSADIYEMKGIHKERPAVIVSAGPSLSKNIQKLKKVEGEFIIIAGNRTLKPLVESGIKPDYLCVVDPNIITHNNMNGYYEETRDIALIYPELIPTIVLEEFKGEKIFTVVDPGITKLVGEKDFYNFIKGGSVAHYATRVAEFMGCSPIIFVGQDLAFTGEKRHADMAKNKNSNNEIDKKDSFLVKDVFGEMVRTDKSLNIYRKELEKIIDEANNIKFINATEGGAYIEGSEVLTLDEVIGRYSKNTKREKQDVSKIKKAVRYEDAIEYIENLYKIVTNLSVDMKEAVKFNKKMYEAYIKKSRKYGYYNKKVDFYQKILEDLDKEPEMEILNKFLVKVHEDVNTNNEWTITGKEDDEELIRKVYKKTEVLYLGIKDACDKLSIILKEELSNM